VERGGRARDGNRATRTNTAATSGDTTPSAPASASWEPNWRQLGVGFGAGALVTLLLGMQLRQAGRPKG
jgi:hypothetical protein